MEGGATLLLIETQTKKTA